MRYLIQNDHDNAIALELLGFLIGSKPSKYVDAKLLDIGIKMLVDDIYDYEEKYRKEIAEQANENK